MIPAPRLLWLIGLSIGLGLVTVFWPDLETAWLGAVIAMLAIAWVDHRAGRRLAEPEVARRVAGSLPLGVWTEVRLRLHNPSQPALRVAAFDHYPSGDEITDLPQSTVIPAEGWAELRYQLRPRTRGERDFGATELRIESPLRLWRKRTTCGEPERVRVYPNFAEVSKYALLATDNRLSQMGIRKRLRRGEGLEFHQLREYHEGDSLRQIDWKATSRMKKLISREYQSERDQQMVVLLDCGRRMLARDGELSHFDHSLNSVLLLAHVALHQGDLVGLVTFGGDKRFFAPRKGRPALSAFLNTVYDLEPAVRSPDYIAAATEVMKRINKRSLVVLVTNLRDEDLDEALSALRLMQRRHLVLLASLRERVVSDVLRTEAQDFRQALALAATHRYLLARRRTHDTIRRHGVYTLDVEPERLPIGLVNRYLDIKRTGVL